MINSVKEIRNMETNELTGYLVDGMSVPLAEGNRHYQEVMKWIAEGNTPEPAFTITELHTAKIQEIATAYNTANQLDIGYMNTTFQADKASQDLIVSVLSAGSVPSDFFWLDASNNQVSMTYAELQGLSGAILARNQANFVKYQTLKSQVKSVTTQSELDAIVW